MFLRDSGCIGKVTSYNEFTVYYSDCIELNLYVIIIIDLILHSNVIANIEYKTYSNILS